MSGVTRYETKVEDGTYYLESPDGWLEIGPMDALVDLLGGEEYTLEYTQEQASASWLNTDDDATITVDVRETLESMSFTDDVVSNVANCSLDREGEQGYPIRTEVFADLFGTILETKGNVDL